MNRWIVAILTLCSASWAVTARAETCTVSGTYKFDVTDFYYCDTTQFGTCPGWNVVDLDTKLGDAAAVPVRYARVRIRNSANTSTYVTAHTNASGFYSATFSSDVFGAGAQCENHSVTIVLDFLRADERDLALASPRYRFRLVDRNDTLRFHARAVPLSNVGNSTTSNFRQPFASVDNPAHYYAVYFTADNAMAEITSWSTNLRDTLTGTTSALQQPIEVDINGGSRANTDAWPTGLGRVHLPWDMYRNGGVIRHELGHWVMQVIHKKAQAVGRCLDGRFPQNLDDAPPPGSGMHNANSCEFGFFSHLEGMATFIGVRSATSGDVNVWMCNGTFDSPRDACSANVFARAGDADADGVTSVYQIIGDRYADRQSRCAVLDATTCGCGANCGQQEQKDLLGFRVETQVARFAWDLIDTSTDVGAVDDVDYSMGGIVAALEGMDCQLDELGVDGTCNEATFEGAGCGKDFYNVYDLAAALATNESAERTLNCVAKAPDCTSPPCP